MTLRAFFALAREMHEAHPYYRTGQSYFNALYALHPDLADSIRGTYRDPFYRDGVVPEFLAYVVEELTKGEQHGS